MTNCHEVERFENLMYKGCEPHWHCVYCDEYWPFHCYDKKDLEQMECPVKTKCHWVSIKDKQPQKSGWYLVYYNGNAMTVAYFKGKSWPFDNHYHNITHWCLLPEPPKEE